MKKYLFSLFLISFNLQAQNVCERIQQGVIPYLETQESRIQFKNRGGLFNGGVCWWHSRLQRASSYLVEFKPGMNPPSKNEVSKILKSLRAMNTSVIIPGYADFLSFTEANKAEVQNMLEGWQKEDGFINQEWVRGISGKYELPATEMKTRMDNLYNMFQKSPHPMWVMAQIKGITSHAFLVLEMVPQGAGYEIRLIDSNEPLITKTYNYVSGDRFLKHPKDKYSFVPYSGFQKDYDLILAAVVRRCGDILDFDKSEIPRGEIEVSP